MRHTILTALLLFCLTVSAQVFRNVNVTHGLYNNHVWLVEALDNRTLLVGTNGNFSIYDGAMFHPLPFPLKTVGVDAHLPISVQRDTVGNLWIKDVQHLYVFSQPECRFLDAPQMVEQRGIKAGELSNVFLDDDGDLWTFSKTGILTVNGQAVKQMERGLIVSGVVQEGQHCYILTSDGCFLVWDKQRRQLTGEMDMLRGERSDWTGLISSTNRSGRKLVAVDRQGGGLFALSGGHLTPVPDGSPSGVLRIIDDGHGGFLVVNYAAIRHYDRHLRLTEEINRLATPIHTFGTQNLLDATIDWQGGLWVANFQNGLFYHHPRGRRMELIPLMGLDELPIIFMERLDDSEIVYGTSQGIYTFNTMTHACTPLDGIRSDQFFGAYVAPDGTLWVASRNGIWRRGKDKTVTRYNTSTISGLPSNRCLWAYPVDSNEVVACFNATRTGIIDTQRMTFEAIAKPDTLSHIYRDYYRSYYDHGQHRVYIGCAQGTLTLDIATRRLSLTNYGSDEDNRLGQSAVIFLRTASGTLLTATNGALIANFQDGHRAVGRKEGLPSSFIHAMAEDEQERIWVATAQGLSRIEGAQTLLTDNPNIFNTNVDEVLQGGEFVNGCLLCMGDSVWAGSSKGLMLLMSEGTPPDAVVGNSSPTALQPLFISVETADGEVYLMPRDISLRHNQNFFTLNVSACNYLAPEQTRYSYMLDGVDKKWNTPTNHHGMSVGGLHIAYTNVPSGNYTLKVRLKNDDGSWAEPQQCKITILSPWYNTWWAWLLYLLTAGIVVFAIIKVYRNRRSMMAQLKEKRNKFIVQAQEVKPEEIEITPQDKQLLDQAVQLANDHLADADFGVDTFAQAMGMSRSSLYRTIQQVAGQTPAEFLRTVRLRRAEQLLRESDLSMKEIAYKCGYNDTRTFRKAFIDFYGKAPQEYKQTK